MKRLSLLSTMLLTLALSACASQNGGKKTFKEGANEVGETLNDAAHAVGRGAKKVGKSVADAARKGGQKIKDATERDSNEGDSKSP